MDAPKGAGLGKAQSASEQNYPGVAAGLDGLFIPDTGLHLADVGLAQQEHAQAGLADAAADGEGQLALQQQLVEGKLPPCLAPGEGSKARSSTGFHTRISPLRVQSS